MIREPDFAKRVAACRQKLNLQQTDAANLMGVTRQQFNNWERGVCKPTGHRMKWLATVLQCDAAWLQHGESSEIEQRLENVMLLMRVVVRDLNHIHKALGLRTPPDKPGQHGASNGDRSGDPTLRGVAVPTISRETSRGANEHPNTGLAAPGGGGDGSLDQYPDLGGQTRRASTG